MKGIKKKLIIMVLTVVSVIAGTGIFVFADVNEYKVCHNITINLGGGSCKDIYYESQEDRGANAGVWFKDLRTGQNVADWYGKYHVINDYNAAVPKDGQTITGYYDCVGVTPYVTLGSVSREGYIFAGWEVSVDAQKNYDYGADGIRVYIGAFTGKDITITAKWERCSYNLAVNTYYLSEAGEWRAQDENNMHCDVNIDIDDERKETGVTRYYDKVQGDKKYSAAVNVYTGWKLDLEKSSHVSGVITEDTKINIYVRPIEYEIRLYGNKPDDSSSNINLCSPENWIWCEEGYYSSSFSYDTRLYIPEISEVYQIQGWTGKYWSMQGEEPQKIKAGWQKNLTDTDGDILNLDALWRENSYNINIDMNGGSEDDSVIKTNYEKDNTLPGNLIRPGYNFDSWNTEADGSGTRHEKEDTVSRLVDDDGGDYTIYAQWKRKDIICLRIASSSYGKTMLNSLGKKGTEGWYNEYGNIPAANGKNVSDEKCIQIWNVDRDGIERTK